jgi:hypothetical protein
VQKCQARVLKVLFYDDAPLSSPRIRKSPDPGDCSTPNYAGGGGNS